MPLRLIRMFCDLLIERFFPRDFPRFADSVACDNCDLAFFVNFHAHQPEARSARGLERTSDIGLSEGAGCAPPAHATSAFSTRRTSSGVSQPSRWSDISPL